MSAKEITLEEMIMEGIENYTLYSNTKLTEKQIRSVVKNVESCVIAAMAKAIVVQVESVK